MTHNVTLALRIAAVLVGIFAVYASAFLYEDEQGRIQSRLEDFWIRISDLSTVAISRTGAFMRGLADFSEAVFGRLFGGQLLSLQSVAVSTSFSMASVFLFQFYRAYTYDRMIDADRATLAPGETLLNSTFREEYGPLYVPGLLLVGLFFLLQATVPGFRRATWRRTAWLYSVAVSTLVAAIGIFLYEYFGFAKFLSVSEGVNRHSGGHTSIIWENFRFAVTPELLRNPEFFLIMLSSFLVGIAVGVASDVSFIVLTRWMLRRGARLESPARIGGIVILNCLLAVVLVLGPAAVGYGIAEWVFGPHAYESQFPTGVFSLNLAAEWIQQTGFVASLSNLVTACAASVFVVLGIAALLHRIFWPVIERPVYALQRLGIARRSRLLGAGGLTLIGLGFGVIPSWLKDLVGLLGA